jgi:hypothetical protein
MDARDLARRLLDEVELRRRALAYPAEVVRHLALDEERLRQAARLLEHSGGPHGDAARAVLFALFAAVARR